MSTPLVWPVGYLSHVNPVELEIQTMTFVPNPTRGSKAMAVAPHSLAAQSAMAVMREGGNAVEAMISAAATIAAVSPHMNSIGNAQSKPVHRCQIWRTARHYRLF